jgi:RNA polymerase-binding transcription factor DksA
MFCDIITSIMDTTQARRRLEREREQRQILTGHLREENQPVEAGELSKVDQHPGELGTETFERERDLTTITMLHGELEDIEWALRHLDDGSYGKCEECGKPIGDERLEAKPWARLCLIHQAELERTLSRR